MKLPGQDSSRMVYWPTENVVVIEGANPRRRFDDTALEELADSIREHGVLEPLVCRQYPKLSQNLQLICGERRLRAAKAAGLATVPCVIREVSDAEITALMVVENLQREGLSAIEEAHGYRQLADAGMTQEAIGKTVGKSQPAVANALRLLRLPEAVQGLILEGKLTAAHGVELVRLIEMPGDLESEMYRCLRFDLPASSLRRMVDDVLKRADLVGHEARRQEMLQQDRDRMAEAPVATIPTGESLTAAEGAEPWIAAPEARGPDVDVSEERAPEPIMPRVRTEDPMQTLVNLGTDLHRAEFGASRLPGCEIVHGHIQEALSFYSPILAAENERRFGRAPFGPECDTDPHGQTPTDTDGAECGEACVCDLVGVEPDPNQTEAIPDEPEPIDMDAEIAAEQAFAEARSAERLRTSAPDMATAAGTVYTPRLGDSIRHREKPHMVFHVIAAGPDGVSVISATGTNLASTLEPSDLGYWWLVPGGVKSAEVAK